LIIAAWLLTFSFIIDNYWSSGSSLNAVQEKLTAYLHKQQSDLKKVLQNRATIDKIASQKYDEVLIEEFSQKKYFLFFYTSNDAGADNLIWWNTQKIIPLPFMQYGDKTIGFLKMNNGYYVWERKEVGQLKIISLIPIKWDYYIVNEYLQNDFVVNDNISSFYELTNKPDNAALVSSLDGKPLFYVYEKRSAVIKKSNPIAIAFQLLSIIFIFLYIHFVVIFIFQKRRFSWGVCVLIFLTLSIRIASYYFNIPFNTRQFELFNPSIFSSGPIMKSLGDLFINAVLFLWMMLLIKAEMTSRQRSFAISNKILKWLIMLLAGILLIAPTFIIGNIVRALVVDSQISFDVTNFFTLTQYSIIGFVTLCILAFGFVIVFQTVFALLQPLWKDAQYFILLTIAIEGLLYLTFNIGNIKDGFEIYMLLWLLIVVALFHIKVNKILSETIVSSKLVLWLVLLSLSISAIILVENNKKELSNRKHYAEILALKSDPANETLINSMLTNFRQDFLVDNFSRFLNQASNAALKDSLINGNTSGYTNKFDTHIFTYTEAENGIFNEDSTSYNELNTILNTQSRPTSISGLYYFDQSYDLFSYISKKTVKDTSNQTIGYIFVLATPKKQRRDALYPELFTKGNVNSIENSSAYAFALYNKWKLISSHNDYPFPYVIPKHTFNVQAFTSINRKQHNELWFNAGAGKLVIIAKENNFTIGAITLFSYLFCSFLLVAAMLWLINWTLHIHWKSMYVSNWKKLSLRNQIHGTIIFVSVLSFVVIGIATILFFINRYETNNREKLSRTIRIMEREVKNTIVVDWNKMDSTHTTIQIADKQLELAVQKISDIHGLDINLYDLEGNLRISSLPLPYKKGILSTKMDPVAYYHMNIKKEIQYFQKENIGKLNFVSNYIPVIDAAGNNYAYLNIPYFTSENILKQEISNFLITIINLNAFIFLLGGIVSLFITNSITSTFTLISERMKRINLGKENEQIEWNRDDEIGALVLEYNKMVKKLEESAKTLAQTEREGAWKEMAKQVAHEIKNPLTPMKLSLQFLQKSIENNAPNINELAKNVSNTIIEQINHLSNIANAFSQFAYIGDANTEYFDLNELLRSVVLLYDINDHISIERNLIQNNVIIKADKTQINRLFTNLLLNAIQSIPEGRSPHIVIAQQLKDNYILTEIRDNGQGIDETAMAKIFTPNFTTKSSGTGLGLAMCKRIVEQSEGNIWFNTTVDVGTSFFVELPLLNEDVL